MLNNLRNNLKNNKFLFLITLAYFALGFVNIHFALLGLVCMILPFVLLIKNKQKTWCHGYCPRAHLYTKAGKLTSKHSKTPKFFTKGNMKWIMVSYFGLSLFIITMTTFKVATGRMPSMNYLRLFIIFPIGKGMPQLVEFTAIMPWITHLSYRFYSMMMTTTLLGLVLAFIYKPRTWCTICPIATLSDAYIKATKNSKQSSSL